MSSAAWLKELGSRAEGLLTSSPPPGKAPAHVGTVTLCRHCAGGDLGSGCQRSKPGCGIRAPGRCLGSWSPGIAALRRESSPALVLTPETWSRSCRLAAERCLGREDRLCSLCAFAYDSPGPFLMLNSCARPVLEYKSPETFSGGPDNMMVL